MNQISAALRISVYVATGLLVGSVPSLAQSPAPTITINGDAAGSAPEAATEAPAAAPAATEAPAPAAKVVPAATPPAAKKKQSTEVLPWTNKPLAPATAAAPIGDVAATEAAAAQCSALFEAACRDLKTCAWVADVALQDGTQVPARCVARPPAPPKKSATKKQAPPKKTAVAPEEAHSSGAAPAVKASVTRIEDEQPAKTEHKRTEKKEAAAAPEPDAQPEAPVAEVEKPKQPEKPKVEPVKQADSAPSGAPIVVKPPQHSSPGASAKMPSFGSVSPIMPGGGDAVVVTVPPSQ